MFENQAGKKVPVTFDFQHDRVIGEATVNEDGTISAMITDPEIIKAMRRDYDGALDNLAVSFQFDIRGGTPMFLFDHAFNPIDPQD